MGEVVNITPQTALEKPDWMKNQPIEGVEELARVVRPPRLKIIQKQSGSELQAKFNVGDVILSPMGELLAAFNKGGVPSPFLFTPIFYFEEFCQWAPLALKGKVPMITARTTNPMDALAKKCLSNETRTEMLTEVNGQLLGQAYEFKNLQHLNFICVVNHDGHPLNGTMFLMTFASGSFAVGTRLASLIKQRKASPFMCIFQGSVNPTPRKNERGDWYVLEFTQPQSGSPWTTEEQFGIFQREHNSLREDFRKGRVDTALEEHEDPAAAATGPEQGAKF